jgi:glycosyltransferase involved in cell wall biosynthesis
MRKKRILIHSNAHTAFTGFGKNSKNILKYLFKTNKYDIYELGNGKKWSENKDYYPWQFYGSLPDDPNILNSLNSNPELARSASYGLLTIDKAVELINPDVYIGIEDVWAFSETVKKNWWNKTNCMVWTTLDSLPILPDAINMASKIKNYYVWSSFAEKAMHKIGINHVKTLHGSIDEKNFFKLSANEKSNLRKKFNISNQDFIIGFVFRNQLRKTVGDLIAGFKIFQTKNPELNSKLLLHTNWAEGWDIPRLLSDHGVDFSDVLTTYHCNICKNYIVNSFHGNCTNCVICKSQNSLCTTSVINGVSEKQLNEIYNLMDLYVHPFTSGGQEIPIQEAKLTELITLVTNYTCGEEMCTEESGGFPLLWSPYREIGTQFIKASTSPLDIANKIEFVYKLDSESKNKLGKIARKYVIDNYSFNVIGKKLESIIDNMPEVDFNYSKSLKLPNPNYIPQNVYQSDIDFIIDLYKNILSIDMSKNDKDVFGWVNKLRAGENPVNIVNYFKQTALKQTQNQNNFKINDLIDVNDGYKKIAIVIPNDLYISLLLSLFIKPLKQKYKDYKIYIFTEKFYSNIFFEYSDCIEKILPLFPNCNNKLYMEGHGDHQGFFEIAFIINFDLLNLSQYSQNGI